MLKNISDVVGDDRKKMHKFGGTTLTWTNIRIFNCDKDSTYSDVDKCSKI